MRVVEVFDCNRQGMQTMSGLSFILRIRFCHGDDAQSHFQICCSFYHVIHSDGSFHLRVDSKPNFLLSICCVRGRRGVFCCLGDGCPSVDNTSHSKLSVSVRARSGVATDPHVCSYPMVLVRFMCNLHHFHSFCFDSSDRTFLLSHMFSFVFRAACVATVDAVESNFNNVGSQRYSRCTIEIVFRFPLFNVSDHVCLHH